jgi:pilus assembly protein CpaE
MITIALGPLGHQIESASNGLSGLDLARQTQPDLIISDVMMPDITGYEVVRRLRREPRFAHTPILILTSQADLQDKLQAFEAGADDHVAKPFEVEELIARVTSLLRRAEAAQATAQPSVSSNQENAQFIAVHSLRGGAGCSTLALNLALALRGLWETPTMMLDLVLMAGQVALMLNWSLKRTWADVTHVPAGELDMELIRSVTTRHESGMHFIPAPTYPSEAETIHAGWLQGFLDLTRPAYDYIVADLPHDFSDVSIQALDTADMILLLLAPEMSSLRAAAAALDTYDKLNYEPEKIKLVINSTFPRSSIPREKIESAVGRPVSLTIPHIPDRLVEAINKGQPPMFVQPEDPFSALIEDYAFLLSKPRHKKMRPEQPSAGWKRVYKRFTQRKK